MFGVLYVLDSYIVFIILSFWCLLFCEINFFSYSIQKNEIKIGYCFGMNDWLIDWCVTIKIIQMKGLRDEEKTMEFHFWIQSDICMWEKIFFVVNVRVSSSPIENYKTRSTNRIEKSFRAVALYPKFIGTNFFPALNNRIIFNSSKSQIFQKHLSWRNHWQ